MQSINQNELWDKIANKSSNIMVGKGDIVRQLSLTNYKPRLGPFESTEQIHD